MLSPNRVNRNNIKKQSKRFKNTDFDNNSHNEAEVKRPQMSSNDPKRPQSTPNRTKVKNNLRGGSIQENVEINEHYLDKILQNNNT